MTVSMDLIETTKRSRQQSNEFAFILAKKKKRKLVLFYSFLRMQASTFNAFSLYRYGYSKGEVQSLFFY